MATLSLDHLTVGATNKWASAKFLAEMFDLPTPEPYGPFAVVYAEPTAILFSERSAAEFPHHLAFVVSDDEFDAIMDRLHGRGITFFADPFGTQPGDINHRTGRGVYFRDPDDHMWEAITHTDRGLL